MRVSGARNLQRGRQQQRHGERRKCNGDGTVEAMGFVVDFRGVAGHRDQITAVGTEVGVAFDDAQILVFRAVRIALAVFGARGRFIGRQAR